MLVNSRSEHPLFRLCVYFEFNKFSLTFLETISDCSDQTIIVAPVWGQFNLPSETGSRTKTDIYNFLSVTIIVSCVHLEISNYNKNLPKLAPRPLLGSSFISGYEISSYSLFRRVQYWARSASSYPGPRHFYKTYWGLKYGIRGQWINYFEKGVGQQVLYKTRTSIEGSTLKSCQVTITHSMWNTLGFILSLSSPASTFVSVLILYRPPGVIISSRALLQPLMGWAVSALAGCMSCTALATRV